MFDAVAKRYDITNTVLSLGQDRSWRRATRAALGTGPGDRVLDLAAGTAVSTVELTRSGAWCVAADFSVGMLQAGAARPVPKVAADATKLPFADEVFDAVTISCESCGADVHRIADVGDVWLDAGIVPFSTLGWQSPELVPGGYETGG